MTLIRTEKKLKRGGEKRGAEKTKLAAKIYGFGSRQKKESPSGTVMMQGKEAQTGGKGRNGGILVDKGSIMEKIKKRTKKGMGICPTR